MVTVPPKPSVFFSHASVDGAAIAALKKRFLEITGGAIDVFVSSDGQSIRFGRNWVSEIGDALGRCALMFVFVTPRSLSSGWIFFEAGHAYGRDIKVVPVAILGADLNALPGPLALLQGFNVKDPSGLDNIVAIVNAEFSQSHDRRFTSQDFAAIAGNTSGAADVFCAPYTNLITSLRLELDLTEVSRVVPAGDRPPAAITDRLHVESAARTALYTAAWATITQHLKQKDIVFTKKHETLHLEGMTVEPGGGGQTMAVQIEAGAARRLLPVAESIARALKPNDELSLTIWFANSVACDFASHRVTGRLSIDGVVIDKDSAHRSVVPPLWWRDHGFQLGFGFGRGSEPSPKFLATSASKEFDLDWVEALVLLLFERGIFFPE